MRRQTAELFRKIQAAMATSYGVADVREKFTADVPMAIALNDKIQASSAFLQQITVLPVTDIKGRVVQIAIPSTVAGRTNTANGPRQPQMAGAPTDRSYECRQTNYDVGIDYSTLDAWARFPDFMNRYMNAIYQRIGLDIIMIGWHGQSAADTTDRAANPLLQDVNTGWLYDLKTNNPAHFMQVGEKVEGKISIGATGDYQNLDQMVYDIASIIPDEHRTGKEVAIIGRGLVAHDVGKTLAAMGDTPSEKLHFQTLGKSYGTYTSVLVPGFPDNGLIVTDPANLHRYYQDSSIRRNIKEEPEYNRVVNFTSSNDAYMIGDLDGAAAIEAANVVFV